MWHWFYLLFYLIAARVALIFNNTSVLVCCILVFVVLTYKQQIEEKLDNKLLLYIFFALIVIVTIITNLCNLGRTLIMERDWIVEICGRHKDTIASMSFIFYVCFIPKFHEPRGMCSLLNRRYLSFRNTRPAYFSLLESSRGSLYLAVSKCSETCLKGSSVWRLPAYNGQ